MNIGEGQDIYRKLRIIPLTKQAKESIMQGSDFFKYKLDQIVSNYDELINYLKE